MPCTNQRDFFADRADNGFAEQIGMISFFLVNELSSWISNCIYLILTKMNKYIKYT